MWRRRAEGRRAESSTGQHGALLGTRSFCDKSQPGLLTGQSLVRIYYFLRLACSGLCGCQAWGRVGSKPFANETLRFHSSLSPKVNQPLSFSSGL